MCGGCGGAPPDWALALIAGPRRRADVAKRMTQLLNHHAVRPIVSGWVLSTATGHSEVCRTYDQLVDAVSRRTTLPRDEISHHGLGLDSW